MYYSKCHGKLPLPGIFRFPANCHAPSVLLLLLVAQGIDGFTKRSVNFTIGKLIDELKAFKRFVRLLGGRRNIYVWILALGLILGTVAGAFKLIAWWEAVTAAVHLTRVARHCGLSEVRVPPPRFDTSFPSLRQSLPAGLGTSLVA